ncbi:MAG: hypothetical protein ACHQJ6_07395 [Candidatus Berkiellales bacterium]
MKKLVILLSLVIITFLTGCAGPSYNSNEGSGYSNGPADMNASILKEHR